MKWFEVIKQVFHDGGPSTCQFAITNVCNARCSFCNFSRDKAKPEDRKVVDRDAGMRALDILYAQGVRFMIFTGGEPTTHPYLFDFMRRCQILGMETMIVTNGSTLSAQLVTKLAKCGLKSAIISIDSIDSKVHENNRGLPGVCAKVKAANEAFKEFGIGSIASVTYSRIMGDINALPAFLKELGFEAVTFSLPLTGLDSSYLGFADTDVVSFNKDELHTMLQEIAALSKVFPVLNPIPSLDDMHRYLDGKPQLFECYGGFKQFYLDWDMLLWRCNNWRTPMCPIEEFDGSQIVRDGCTGCMVDCYRDSSVQQHIAVSLSDSLALAKRGKWKPAASELFSRQNFQCLKALKDAAFWMRRL